MGAAAAAYEEAIALSRTLDSALGLAGTLCNLGILVEGRGELARARGLYEEGLALYRTIGDERGVAVAAGLLGIVAKLEGQFDLARALLKEGVAVLERQGDRANQANALYNLGEVLLEQGMYGRAQAVLERGRELAREFEMGDLLSWITLCLGKAAFAQTEGARGFALVREALEGFWRRQNSHAAVSCLATWAGMWIDVGQHEAAARLLGTLAQTRPPHALNLLERARLSQATAQATAALGTKRFGTLFEQGRHLSLKQGVAALLSDSVRGASGSAMSVDGLEPTFKQTVSLNEGERAVLRLAAQGLPDPAIGQALSVSERTVRYRLASARRKLGARNRTQAIALALHHL